MKKFIGRVKDKTIQGALPAVAVIIVLLVIIATLWELNENNNIYRVIKITGETEVSNLSKLELFDYTSPSNDSACYVLVENGDLIGLGNTLYRVSESTGDSLAISYREDTAVYINDRLYTIIISAKTNLLPFLKSLKEEEIKSLSNIEFGTVIPDSYLPYLKRIASLNKEVSLYFAGDSSSVILKDYFSKANFFNPGIFSGTINASFYSSIAGLTNINTLFISMEDSVYVPLPNLPALKTCIMIDADKMTPNLVMENNREANFLYTDTDIFSNKDLKKFKQLPTLGIHIYDSALLIGLDEVVKHTTTLYITADSDKISGALKMFPNVKWLIINGDLPQSSFNRVINYFKNLRVLEIENNTTLQSYGILKQYSKLHALIIRDTVTDVGSLTSLKQLKYLSLPQHLYGDNATLKPLEKALPGCIITPNSGACLGPGWILLLIPMLIICFKIDAQRKKFITGKHKKENTDGRHPS